MSHSKLVGVLCADDSDSLSEGEEYLPESEVSKLPWGSIGPKLTQDEIRMKKTYSYDPEPVKAWREITDYMAIKECNESLWSKISNLVGKKHGYHNSLFLYRDRHSKIVNVIERMLCPKKCYFSPTRCLFKHGFDFKNLLKQKLHKRFGSTFETLFRKDTTKIVELERLRSGQPNMIKLADDIGFTTDLDYDESGFLKVDLSVFREEFWNNERPCFVKEEKKVLDILYGMLISSTTKQEEELSLATKHYSQTNEGINDPVLKIMNFGPDYEFDGYPLNEGVCDMAADEEKAGKLSNVEHKKCSYFKRRYHWTFVHFPNGDKSQVFCEIKGNLVLDGPVSVSDASIRYPCNLKHCWRCCLCTFCQLARQLKCDDDHKNHIIYNVKKCKIQELAQCQKHWLDHPDNFNASEDIRVEQNILFHNDEVKKDGRNCHFRTVQYAGLPLSCRKCRMNTKEHLSDHLTPHMQCKHCIYEMKTMQELSFWSKVCRVCGKILDDEHLKMRHQKKHDIEVPDCEVCHEKCSTIYNLHRHMLEQHNSFHGENWAMSAANEPFVCLVCAKSFKYQRNLDTHINITHTGNDELQCQICDKTFGTKFTLKRHLNEQHNITQVVNSIHSDEIKIFTCKACDSVFKQKGNLKVHELTHMDDNKFTCDQCGKQYSVKTSLVRHLKIHTGEREKYQCGICHKMFLSKGSLARHMEGIHRP